MDAGSLTWKKMLSTFNNAVHGIQVKTSFAIKFDVKCAVEQVRLSLFRFGFWFAGVRVLYKLVRRLRYDISVMRNTSAGVLDEVFQYFVCDTLGSVCVWEVGSCFRKKSRRMLLRKVVYPGLLSHLKYMWSLRLLVSAETNSLTSSFSLDLMLSAVFQASLMRIDIIRLSSRVTRVRCDIVARVRSFVFPDKVSASQGIRERSSFSSSTACSRRPILTYMSPSVE